VSCVAPTVDAARGIITRRINANVIEEAADMATKAKPRLDRFEVGYRSSAAAATLISEKETNDFRTRWTGIQTGFVDELRRSVEQADALVAEVIKCLANSFAEERSELGRQWGRGDDVSTKDLRVALQRYRTSFDRLLSV
jgi:hypothetical protein